MDGGSADVLTLFDGGYGLVIVGSRDAVVDPNSVAAGPVVQLLLLAIQSRQWGLVAGALLSLSIVVLRIVRPNLPPHLVRVAAALGATLPAVALALLQPGISAGALVATSVESLFLAAGLWELALKDMGMGAAIKARKVAVEDLAKTDPDIRREGDPPLAADAKDVVDGGK